MRPTVPIAGQQSVTTSRTVHLCAAKEDKETVDLLLKHLNRSDVTHAGLIGVGDETDAAHRTFLDAAHVIVLLISSDFLSSPDHEAEVECALRRHRAKGARLVLILGRPCDWDKVRFAGAMVLPRDEVPLMVSGELREEAIRDVAREIRSQSTHIEDVDAACPFPGLEFFGEDREADFFGREDEVSEALAKLSEGHSQSRWLQIDGPSGVGKSSFARAGIIPAVRQGRLSRDPNAWITAILRPGHDPIASLAESLVKHAKPPLHLNGRDLDLIRRDLSGSPTALASLLREATPAGKGVLLLVDQFEEAFTLAPPDDKTGNTTNIGMVKYKQFDALLAAAIDELEAPLLLVTTIRSDFITQMGELPRLERKLQTQAVRYYLPPMDDKGLRAAIEMPAARSGITFQDGLVDRIVADARISRGALPLVAHVLKELYAHCEGRTLSLRAYDQLGGVGGGLAKSADAIMKALDEADRMPARRLLLRLVAIRHGSEDTRRTAERREAIDAAGGGTAGERVLARLSGGRAIGLAGTSDKHARLVVVSGEEGCERVDLVHNILIQRWETLQGWIRDERHELELREDVEHASRVWRESGGLVGDLPRGAVLQRYERVDRVALHEDAQEFMRRAERERAEIAHRFDLESARKQRSGRIRNVAIGLTLNFFLLSAVYVIIARTERAHFEARGYALFSAVAGAESGPRLQALVAVEAWKRGHMAERRFYQWWDVYPPIEIERALYDAVYHKRAPERLMGRATAVPIASAEFKSARLLTRPQNSNAYLVKDGKERPLGGHTAQVNSAVFSPDGLRIVTAADDGTIRIWRGDGYAGASVLRTGERRVLKAAFSTDGRQIVAEYDDGQVVAWTSDLEALAEEACNVAGGNFTPDEWTSFFGDTAPRKTCEKWP